MKIILIISILFFVGCADYLEYQKNAILQKTQKTPDTEEIRKRCEDNFKNGKYVFRNPHPGETSKEYCEDYIKQGWFE